MSGLLKSKELLGHLSEISVVDFDHSDVVRHHLFQKIVKAYSKNDCMCLLRGEEAWSKRLKKKRVIF